MRVRHHLGLALDRGPALRRRCLGQLRREAMGWDRPLDAADLTMAVRVDGPVIDMGCGPGRFAAVFNRLGIPALGLDVSPAAVRLARRRGAEAVAQCVFGPVPGEGNWAYAILPDGNIGIGGDPTRLLRRATRLVIPGGTIHVELDPPDREPGRVILRLGPGLQHNATVMPWARVTTAQFLRLAREVGLEVCETWNCQGRWFASATTSAESTHRNGGT